MTKTEFSDSPAKLFIIDDNSDDLLLMETALSDAGYLVKPFKDARQALAHIVAEAPDLIVTDVFMDGMEGVETLRAVVEGYPDIPVIVVSGAIQYLELMPDLGAQAAVVKTQDYKSLLDAVQRVLHQPAEA